MRIAKLKHIHFTGIKGVGMTCLALCAKNLGIKVTGSDVAELFITDKVLDRAGIKWKVGLGKKNLRKKPDLLVTTAAHGGLKNPEVLEAKQLGIPVLTYAELLAEFSKEKEVIAVCGVGGKTTTSSMISTLLDHAGMEPSFVVGVSDIYPIGTPARYNQKGRHFVCEADDYVVSPGVNNTPKFLLLDPKVIVVTNIEYDHPDIYKNLSEIKRVFRKFFNKLPSDGLLVACIDNLNVLEVIKNFRKPVATYGFNNKADFQIKNIKFKPGKTVFDLSIKKEKRTVKNIKLSVPGRFNAQNATAAFIVGKSLGINDDVLKKGITKYLGCRRRFEKMGERNGVLFYDDYAHHPKEIKSTLMAAKEWFPKRRIVAIFQPHTYSRTKSLFQEFSKAFDNADVVTFMEIYASARESKDASISSEILTRETKKHHKCVYYTKDHEKTIGWINKFVKKGDVVITMGAGNIFHLYNDLFK